MSNAMQNASKSFTVTYVGTAPSGVTGALSVNLSESDLGTREALGAALRASGALPKRGTVLSIRLGAGSKHHIGLTKTARNIRISVRVPGSQDRFTYNGVIDLVCTSEERISVQAEMPTFTHEELTAIWNRLPANMNTPAEMSAFKKLESFMLLKKVLKG